MFKVRRMGMGRRIRLFRERAGITLEALEQLSGVDKGTISALENRDSSRSQYFPALAKAFGLTVEQLGDEEFETAFHLTSVGGRLVSVRPRRNNPDSWGVEEPRAAYGMEPILAWEHPEDLPPGEFVMVPRLDVHLSAGNGHDQVEIELVKENPQAFRTEWIRQQRLKPAKLAAMRASGESMEPTIHGGDSLLIDTSQTDVVDGRVYALWYDGGERVKRLFRLPGGGLRIKSDNAAFDVIELGAEYPGQVRVIGRVVHRSGIGGL